MKRDVMLKKYAHLLITNTSMKSWIETIDKWVKRWWWRLNHHQRGEVSKLLKRGLQPKSEHFIGAPSLSSRSKMLLVGRADSSMPAIRVKLAAKKSERKRRKLKKARYTEL